LNNFSVTPLALWERGRGRGQKDNGKENISPTTLNLSL
jgi:hypothetical protein